MYKVRNGATYFIRRSAGDYSPRSSVSGEQIVNITWIEDGFGRMDDGNYSGFWVAMSDTTEYTPPPPPTEPPAAGDVPFTITIGDGVVYEKQVIEGVAKKL